MPRKPKPFKRPSIDLDHGKSKEWKNVQAKDVKVGDIVADYGQVSLLEQHSDGLDILFLSGKVLSIHHLDKVFAFTE